MNRSFWYYTVNHSVCMMNMIPGKYGGKLASPFLLVHGVHLDQRTWVLLFLLCYFHHKKDSDSLLSNNQVHTLNGIAVGRIPLSNAILVYNPCSQRYYKPDSYRLDPYQLPSSVYPTINLFISLHWGDSSPIREPYSPATCVKDFNKSTNVKRLGTIMNIPMDATSSPHYLIQFDDGTTKSVKVADMSSLIPKPLANVSDSTHLLPPFLRTPKSPLSTMASTTKATSHNCLIVPIASAISCM
jgi:hypothetical protein